MPTSIKSTQNRNWLKKYRCQLNASTYAAEYRVLPLSFIKWVSQELTKRRSANYAGQHRFFLRLTSLHRKETMPMSGQNGIVGLNLFSKKRRIDSKGLINKTCWYKLCFMWLTRVYSDSDQQHYNQGLNNYEYVLYWKVTPQYRVRPMN